jgi:hypothetical protein
MGQPSAGLDSHSVGNDEGEYGFQLSADHSPRGRRAPDRDPVQAQWSEQVIFLCHSGRGKQFCLNTQG